MRKRIEGIGFIVIWGVLFTPLQGCGGMDEADGASSGYLVLGPRAADAFGLMKGDTIPEVAPRTVPQNVAEKSRELAEDYEFDPACSRYFAARKIYIALLRASCGNDLLYDGEVLAAIDLTGTIIFVIPTVSHEDIEALVPESRRR